MPKDVKEIKEQIIEATNIHTVATVNITEVKYA